jgi:hypothetical protein
MTGMAHAPGPSHARKSARDHLWVLVVIAGFALYDVWTAWSQLGNKSGFGHAGWTLTVIVEVYLLYALFAWLGGASGPRSRKFAMWSAGFVFLLSLVGQAASRLNAYRIPPAAVVVFVSVLPVVGLMLIAFLIHFRQIDRAEAAEGEQEAAEAGEIARLRAELDAAREAARSDLEALRGELETAQADVRAAQDEAAQAAQERETLARKLEAANRAKKRANPPRNGRATARETKVPSDVDARTAALKVLSDEPAISGAALGPRVGMSKRWGQLNRPELAAMAADLEEQ